MRWRTSVLVSAGIAACGARPEAPTAVGAPWLEEVAAAAGIDFVHRSGHQEGRFLLPEIVARSRLDRGVAAAMQHEQRIAAKQPRGVDSKSDVLADALLGVGLDHFARGTIVPLALHGARCGKFRTFRQVSAAACAV